MHHPYKLTGLTAATLQDDPKGYGLIADAVIVVQDGRIAWAGSAKAMPAEHANLPARDLGGRLVTPGLVDCHTHLVFGGNRAGEFEMRLNGASYADIARAGGGIMSTVAATRAASSDDLLRDALHRVDHLIGQGVCSVEIKSGYGLDIETELKMLRVAREIGKLRPIHVRTSFLGAHATPKGPGAQAYLREVCIPALRQAHAEGLVDAVDGFCENIAFTPSQIGQVFDVARELGLPVKLHSEQLSWQGGTQLAARRAALSVDHVEYATEDDARAMAANGCVAVLLPGAYYTLHETQKPPVEAFRSHGVPMALATDWNPGSSPMGSVLLAMNMGCTIFGLTPVEALQATTRNAARALGMADHGVIAPGFAADLAIWDAESPAELSYHIGVNPLHARIFKGDPCALN